ncbi:MAG: dihydrolipoyl dehydrogenase [Candidatus Omnitrophica bacterium]|nr:dihydrolipoyl dehydrogenase [Candidatus Omnitrophota bacterium]
MKNYNLIVIGAGPAGYVAAIRASQLGAKVGVVEKEAAGGICLNKGCIPTKCLIGALDPLVKAKRAEPLGIKVTGSSVDLVQLMAWKDKVVTKLVNGILFLFKSNGIELIKGFGRIKAADCVEVTGEGAKEEIKTEKIILASGSSPLKPKSFPFDDERFLTSDELLSLTEVPKSLVIIGGGAIGCEFAVTFNRLGAEVTIYEMMDHLLPLEDEEVGHFLEGCFKRKGIKIFTKTRVEEPRNLTAEKILVAIGRSLNLENLGLDNVGIKQDEKGNILVNEKMETNIPNIYAAGDITGKGLLAYLASRQGMVAAENSQGFPSTMDYRVVPSCIFTDPEVGTVGLTEKEAREKYPVSIGKFPLSALGKAHAVDEIEGFVKIIAEKETGEILGAEIVGPGATDLITILALAMKLGAKVKDLSELIYGHPTFAESIREAAEDIEKRSIHLPKK